MQCACTAADMEISVAQPLSGFFFPSENTQRHKSTLGSNNLKMSQFKDMAISWT